MNPSINKNEFEEKFLNIIKNYELENFVSYFIGRDFRFKTSSSNEEIISRNKLLGYYTEKRNFVHWTTISNLFSIINYREIRLYNLYNSTDQDEFNYAAKQLLLEEKKIEQSKNNLYTLSFCSEEEKFNTYLWNKYGKKYSGVAIEFEIVNDPYHWKKFMLAQVKYNLPNHLIAMINQLNNLIHEYKGTGYSLDLAEFIAFHKKPYFKKENEFRLSVYTPFEQSDEYWKFCNKEIRIDNNRPRLTDYFGLKIWVDNTSPYVVATKKKYSRKLILPEDYFLIKPKIKLKNIYFGKKCGLDYFQFGKLKQELKEIINYKLGYEVGVCNSLIDENTKA